MVAGLSYLSPHGVTRGPTAPVIIQSRRPTISSVTPSLGSDRTLSLQARQRFQLNATPATGRPGEWAFVNQPAGRSGRG
jgi:hypothetical protein